MTHFTVPLSAPGVSLELTWDTMGLRSAGSHTIVFCGVFVADAAVALIRPVAQLGEVVNAHTAAAGLIAAMVRDAEDLHFANTDEHASRILSRTTIATTVLMEAVRRVTLGLMPIGWPLRAGFQRDPGRFVASDL